MPKEETLKTSPVAVIDIGTSAIRMVVAEIGPKMEIRIIENLQKSVGFGKDVFSTGSIGNASLREALTILDNFKTVAQSYGVSHIKAVATSAVRESSNRDNLIDRIYVRTGIDVEVLEGPEESRLGLIAVEHALGDTLDISKKNCLIVEVSSGSTELIVLNQGQVEMNRTLLLGSMRLPEQIHVGKTVPATIAKLLRRHVHDVVAYTANEYNFSEIDTVITVGADMRLACRRIKEKPMERYETLEKKEFLGLIDRIGSMAFTDIASQFEIPYGQAETLYPSLLIYRYFFEETKAESIVVPTVSIRDGILLELSQMLSNYRRTDYSKQVLNSARHLGDKYKYDKPHATCVATLAVKCFDALTAEHGMGAKERLLLEISAILHDIGIYISPSAHHKHSSYLIDAAEIFGLRKTEKDIVSNIVRYHRRSPPKPSHVPYMSLPKADRAVVSKLAAILRVADSLDHLHQQRIKNFSLEKKEDVTILWVSDQIGDITSERNSLRDKGQMFSEVFGTPIDLKQKNLSE